MPIIGSENDGTGSEYQGGNRAFRVKFYGQGFIFEEDPKVSSKGELLIKVSDKVTLNDANAWLREQIIPVRTTNNTYFHAIIEGNATSATRINFNDLREINGGRLATYLILNGDVTLNLPVLEVAQRLFDVIILNGHELSIEIPHIESITSITNWLRSSNDDNISNDGNIKLVTLSPNAEGITIKEGTGTPTPPYGNN